MSGAGSTDSAEVLREQSRECKEECSVDECKESLSEDCEDLAAELDLTVSPTLDQETEREEDDVENLLLHGHKSDLKWSMKDYRPPKYTYVRYR
jgi:hypothetical protein